MSFRVPVTTQEPLVVKERIVRVLNRQVRYAAGTLNASNPVTWRVTVDNGAHWRILGVFVNWSQNAANRQYMIMDILSDVAVGSGNIVMSDYHTMVNPNSVCGQHGIWKIGNGCDRNDINDGTVLYVNTQRSLPDVWLEPGYSVELRFHNGHVLDVASAVIAFEEEVTLNV